MLLLFPTQGDENVLAQLRAELASLLREAPGFLGLAASVGALMGPGAQRGRVGTIVTVDFESLETALGAISSERFATTAQAVEDLGTEIFLFEVALL
jgi:hypothetical protein